MSNNSESFMDLPFIRNLAAYPERTSRQVETIFSNALEQAKNPPVQQNFQDFRELGRNNEEIARGISDVLLSNQRGYDDFSRSMENFSDGIGDMMGDIGQRMGDFTGSLQSIYGGQLPEGKSGFELARELSFNGKRTAVALAAHGGMSDYQLKQMFHPDFVEYLNNGYSSSDLSNLQQEKLSNIYELQKKQSDLMSRRRSIGSKNPEALVGIDRQFSDIGKDILEIKKQLLPSDQIKLLDFAQAARRKSLGQLIADGVIDQKSLELLIRHQKVDGNMALEFSRIVVKDKQGRMKPFVELDGIMGIMQETRINRKIGNVGIVQREKINENLESIDESINDGFAETNRNLGKKLDKVGNYLGDIDDSISDGFDQTNENLIKLNDSLYKIGSFNYGIKIPEEEKKLIDLVKDFGPRGKKTLLSLYAKGMIDESSRITLGQLFSPALFNSLSSKNQNVLDMQNDRKSKIDEIQNQIKSLGNSKAPDIDKKRKQYQSELDGLQQTVMSKEDLEYRDIYKKASETNNINDLIEGDFLDDDVLELLIRNQKVDGQTSLDLARIMKIDENGVNPKLTLDSDVGRWQQLKAQTLQGNMALKQRGMIINELGNVNENLGIIGDGVQKTNWGIDRVNFNLEGIGEELQSLNLGIDNINYNLEDIDGNLEYIGDQIEQTNEGINMVNNNLGFIGNQMVQTNEGIGIVNENLGFIGGQLEQTNKEINLSNQFLNSITNQAIQTNEYLYDILNVGIMNNDLLEESNFLSRISNQLLIGLSEQISFTGEQITQVLEGIGNIIVNGFNESFKLLENLNNFSKGILNELYRQGKLLENINDKMDKPLDIQANENFKYGMELLELSNSDYLSTEYSKDALKSFRKGINLKPTHLYNLYGAGISAGNLGKYKESCLYLQKSYGIAIKQNEDFLAKNISLDIAKICAKNLKMDFAKYWIDKSIVNDKDFVEPYLLKARITKILGQEQEFNVLINIIASQITDTSNELKFSSNYDDVLKYVYSLISITVDKYIDGSNCKELATLIPRLYELGYNDLFKKVTSFLLFNNPKTLLDVSNIRSFMKLNKQYFESLYLEYVYKKLVNCVSDDLFIQAYLGYGIVDFDVIGKILNTGFGCDLDFLAMRESSIIEEKKKYRDVIKTKIYEIGDDAEDMFGEYINKNPYSLLCI